MITSSKCACSESLQSGKLVCWGDTLTINSTRAPLRPSEWTSASSTQTQMKIPQHRRQVCKTAVMGHCRPGAVSSCGLELLSRRRCSGDGLRFNEWTLLRHDPTVLAAGSEQKHQSRMHVLFVCQQMWSEGQDGGGGAAVVRNEEDTVFLGVCQDRNERR